MLKHVLPGARYNSLARDPPPRCLPGTRVRILEDIDARICDKDTRIIWLKGPAGSGKSAIMQTLAEVQSSRTILATLFLSRDHERNDPKKILISLAYSFAILDPTYCQLVEERIALDPDFLSLCMDEQFKCLFVEPFMHHIVQDTRRWVIILDGLDECRDEADQCRIVDLIRNSVLHSQSPLLWIISSRPDAHIVASFSRVKDCVTGFWEQEVPIDSLDASEDVNRYLHVELAKIRELHCDSVPAPPSSWPSDEEFLQLSQLSSGFFCFASSAMKHVASANPLSRLQHILSPKCPLAPLDLMYNQIMSRVPSDVLPNAKAILGFYALHRPSSPIYHSSPNDNQDVGFLTLCNILQMQKYSAYAALRQLSSVLISPSPMEAKDLGIEIIHPSFLQFLGDPARSGFRNVELAQQLERLWNCYLRILRQHKKAKSHSGIDLYWSPHDGTSSELQRVLLCAAQRGLISLLINYSHHDCPRHSCPKAAGLQFKYSDRIASELDELGTMVLDCAEFDIEPFVEWLTRHTGLYIGRTISHERKSLQDLNTERLLGKMYAQQRCLRVVSPNAASDPRTSLFLGKPGILESAENNDNFQKNSNTLVELITTCKSKPDSFRIPVTLIRLSNNLSDQRAVVGPVNGDDASGGMYYVVPY
ncbi:hypothetical protein P691DRAFT_780065 [Macrolepiota fuliginosa MF-IS2]|uniref:NACHT domain-containing protein n=1 Tax=Macrolepiota fuliginosa MF-IS2 TaxID=1400762 RepID=A0A9P5WX49_9AGAR|nr:hypothetical protein P691DRAFT_780065 [Macrolepiota fuliginosa MF-IS2]